MPSNHRKRNRGNPHTFSWASVTPSETPLQPYYLNSENVEPLFQGFQPAQEPIYMTGELENETVELGSPDKVSVKDLLKAYQLVGLPAVLLLEGFRVKGLITNVGKEWVTMTGNLHVVSNEANTILEKPYKIHVNIEAILAIHDAS